MSSEKKLISKDKNILNVASGIKHQPKMPKVLWPDENASISQNSNRSYLFGPLQASTPTGPNSFVLTYNFCRKGPVMEVSVPKREILDPPLIIIYLFLHICCRHFELRMSPRRGLFSQNFKAIKVDSHNQRSTFTIDKNNFYEGIVTGTIYIKILISQLLIYLFIQVQ